MRSIWVTLIMVMGMSPMTTTTAAVPGALAPTTAQQRYLIFSYAYQSATAEAALKQYYGARLTETKQQIVEKEEALKRVRSSLARSQDDASRLAREAEELKAALADLKASLLEELARHDEVFAREFEINREAALEILQSSEGQRAMQIYLDGGPGSARVASDMLYRVARIRTARDLRAIAFTFGNDALAHGRETADHVATMWEKVVEADSDDARAWIELGDLYLRLGRAAEAEASIQKAIPIAKDRLDKLAALSALGDILVVRHNPAKALFYYEQALALGRTHTAANPSSFMDRGQLILSLVRVAQLQRDLKKDEAAMVLYGEAHAMVQAMYRENPLEIFAWRMFSVLNDARGDMLFQRRQYGPAIENYEASLGQRMTLLRDDPTSLTARRDVVVSDNNIGRVAVAMGDRNRAHYYYTDALIRVRDIVQADPSSNDARHDYATTLEAAAKARLGVVSWADVIGILERLHAQRPLAAADMAILERARAAMRSDGGQ